MIPARMYAVRVHAPGDLRYEEVAVPEPGPGEVLLEVARVGMGINDPLIASGAWPIGRERPGIAGHEFAGTVAALGAGAGERHRVAVGDRVVAEQVVPCGACWYCRRGWYNVCDAPALFGLNLDGCWADYMRLPAGALVHPLPAEISWRAAIALESCACGIYTVDRGGLRLGETVVVLGGGFLGLIMVQVARLRGARLVVYVEDDDHRLAVGRRLGADVALNLRRADVVSEVRALTAGLGVDLVVDHGQTEAIELGSRLLRKRGRFVVGAAYASTTAPKIDFGAICNQNELTFIGRTMSGGAEASAFPLAIEYVRRGAIRLEELVTHDIPLAEFPRALEVASRRLEHAIKVAMTP